MTTLVDPWIDVLAASIATLAPGGLQGATVVVHPGLRVMPLLESLGPVAWVHPGPVLFRDFVSVAHGQPALRERLDANDQGSDVSELLSRAALCVVTVPGDLAAARHLAALVKQPGNALWLLHGPADAAGWPVFELVAQVAGLVPLENPGLRMMASPAVLALLARTPAGTGLRSPGRVSALVAELQRRRKLDVHADTRPDTGAVRLRIRPDPVQLIAAGAETLAHHITQEGRALFNTRGLGSLYLPWSGDLTARFLCRNVRARIDDCEIGLGRHAVTPSRIDYTDHGAIMTLKLPPIAPGRDALLHIALPRAAVPDDGFCDIGAAEFAVDMA